MQYQTKRLLCMCFAFLTQAALAQHGLPLERYLGGKPIKLNQCNDATYLSYEPPDDDELERMHIECKRNQQNVVDLTISELPEQASSPRKTQFAWRIPARNQSYAFTLEGACSLHPEASFGDLNRDGKPDFVVNLYCGANGLAGSYNAVMLWVSNPQGYAVHTMTTFNGDVLIQTKSGKIKWMHTVLINAKTPHDQRHHSFWVHHFFDFSGKQLRLLPEPALWVWYSYKGHRVPTRWLSPQAKVREWQDYKEQVQANRQGYLKEPIKPNPTVYDTFELQTVQVAPTPFENYPIQERKLGLLKR